MVDHPVDRPRPATRGTRLGRRLAGRLLLPIHGSLGAVTVVAPVQVSKPSRLASGLNRLKSNTKVRITSKGQVTIPQELRERFGLLPNTEVEFVVTPDGRELRLLKSSKPSGRGRALIERMRGRGTGKLSTDELLKLMRSDV